MIGLQSGRVSLCRTHHSWAIEYRAASAEILQSIPYLAAIEHIGSTAVDDLLAKPIVDIAVSYTDAGLLKKLIDGLIQLGYRYRGYRADAGGHIADFAVSGRTRRHVHLVMHNSAQWKRYLIFRDSLRRSPDARTHYEAFKSELAIRYSENRRAYTAAKVDYIETFIDYMIAEGFHPKSDPTADTGQKLSR